MDLFILPLASSLGVHIACLEANVAFTLHRVDRKTKLLEDGRDYRSLAPQGQVPAIRLPDGTILTETGAVLQYVADLAPATRLAPRWGTPERYRLIEWLDFVGTELHKKHLFMVFSAKTPEAVKSYAASTASPTLAYVARHLDDAERFPFLLGKDFTVADAYLFWALLIAPYGGISVDEHPSLVEYVSRIRERSSVKRALGTELPLYVSAMGAIPSQPSRTRAPSAAT